jgi:DNA-binding NarL/FixJ family response regulator
MHTGRAMSEVLTTRQAQILHLVADGLCSKQIGRRLGISRKTVEVHRADIRRRCGVRELVSLIRRAVRWGWIAA